MVKLNITEKQISFALNNKNFTHSIKELPDIYYNWWTTSWQKNMKFFLEKEGEPDFGIHIGNMCTINTMNQFPMNIAAKGIGLLPKSKYIEEITLRAEELLKRTFIEGKESTFKERISFLKEFFEKDLIDKRSIASLEIYGKTSYNNVIVNPYCALLFNSYISNLSIQLNTIAECLSEDTWEYRFIAARHDLYHIPKKNKANKFICAYRFWVIGAINKSPGKFAGEIII